MSEVALVPWCETCSRFWNPTSMDPSGRCPQCGRQIAEPQEFKAPWHFKLLVLAAALYLGWRLVQGLIWLVDAL